MPAHFYDGRTGTSENKTNYNHILSTWFEKELPLNLRSKEMRYIYMIERMTHTNIEVRYGPHIHD